MSDEPAFVAETLQWCNERRAEKGKKSLKKLPKGIRRDANSCPCGEATGLTVFADAYREQVDSYEGELPVPSCVTEFVQAFDGGQLPQYEA